MRLSSDSQFSIHFFVFVLSLCMLYDIYECLKNDHVAVINKIYDRVLIIHYCPADNLNIGGDNRSLLLLFHVYLRKEIGRGSF